MGVIATAKKGMGQTLLTMRVLWTKMCVSVIPTWLSTLSLQIGRAVTQPTVDLAARPRDQRTIPQSQPPIQGLSSTQLGKDSKQRFLSCERHTANPPGPSTRPRLPRHRRVAWRANAEGRTLFLWEMSAPALAVRRCQRCSMKDNGLRGGTRLAVQREKWKCSQFRVCWEISRLWSLEKVTWAICLFHHNRSDLYVCSVSLE